MQLLRTGLVLALGFGSVLAKPVPQLSSISIDFGGGSSASAAAPTSAAAPSSSAAPAPSSSSAPAPTTSQSLTTPSSVASSSAPASSILFNGGTTTVGFTGPTASSTPYTPNNASTANLPDFTWSLMDPTVSDSRRSSLCTQQMQWCSTAGCVNSGATVKDNWCDTSNMGVRCTCSSGDSRLPKYQWPVESADCSGRNSACLTACQKPGATNDKNACNAACQANFGSTCGQPNQSAADYAVSKKGAKPSYDSIKGDQGSPAWTLAAPKYMAVLAVVAGGIALLA